MFSLNLFHYNCGTFSDASFLLKYSIKPVSLLVSMKFPPTYILIPTNLMFLKSISVYYMIGWNTINK